MDVDSESASDLPDANTAPTASVSAEQILSAEDKLQTDVPASPAGAASGTKSKVDILLKPAGDAPILKKKNWAVERNKKLSYVVEFTSKYLKLAADETLFFYVSQCFAPAPDTELGPLYDCFGSDGKLVLHYCKSQAWG